MSENVILVAFTVEADSMEEAQANLMSSLPTPGYSNIEEWWIAEDERYDRSDNDSAIFVPMGTQKVAHAILEAVSVILTDEPNDEAVVD